MTQSQSLIYTFILNCILSVVWLCLLFVAVPSGGKKRRQPVSAPLVASRLNGRRRATLSQNS